jgi:hypothetical protein
MRLCLVLSGCVYHWLIHKLGPTVALFYPLLSSVVHSWSHLNFLSVICSRINLLPAQTGSSQATLTSKTAILQGRHLWVLGASSGHAGLSTGYQRATPTFSDSFQSWWKQVVFVHLTQGMFSSFQSQNFHDQNYANWVSERISFSNMQSFVHSPIPDYKQIHFLRTSPKGPFTSSHSKSKVLLQRILSYSKILQTSGSNPHIIILIKFCWLNQLCLSEDDEHRP